MPTVAAIQLCSSANIDDNLTTAAHWIAKAKQQQAKLVVLPEMFAIMGVKPADSLQAKEPFGSGKIQDFLSNQAKKYGIWIVGGTIPIASEDPQKAYASCLVFDDQGHCVARYDKMHLFDVTVSPTEKHQESATIHPGNHTTLIDTPIGKVGIGVCYDIRFPELFRELFQHGAEIIVLPAAFTETTGKAHWEVLARSRAIENFCYFIGAAQGGVHANQRKTYGHSLIVNPWGDIIAEKKDNAPGIITAEIDLKKLHEIRKAIPVMEHRKIK